MATLQAVKGMNDILPGTGEVKRWQDLEAKFRRTCVLYGFDEVRTPLCEYIELFKRGVGEDTDIVEKEMYTFKDRGDRDLALRPEGTASAVRAAIEHNVVSPDNPVVRWCYLGPMFRAERPAKGRYRQFHQFGAEVYGDNSPAVDAEVIGLASSYLQSLGIEKFVIHVNSLGGPESRAAYREALVAYYSLFRQRLSPESLARLDRNPLRILDSKDPRDVELRDLAPKISDSLTDMDRSHFQRVCNLLRELGVHFVVNEGLVRGLDYYTSTVFEIIDTSNALGAQNALGGGGRYDRLFKELGGHNDQPAFGFALGVERLLLSVPQAAEETPPVRAVILTQRVDPHEDACTVALRLAKILRAAGIETIVDSRAQYSLKPRMRFAQNKLKATHALTIGGVELANNTVRVKRLGAGVHDATEVSFHSVIEYLRGIPTTGCSPDESGAP